MGSAHSCCCETTSGQDIPDLEVESAHNVAEEPKPDIELKPENAAAFELELRLHSGNQVLNDKILHRLLAGEVDTNQDSNEGSSPSNNKLVRSHSGLQRTHSHQSLRHSVNSVSGLFTHKESKSLHRHIGFGIDIACHKPKELGSSCHICFESSASLQGPVKSYCTNSECKATFCCDCFSRYASTKVMDALHFAPPINCPECKHRVPTAVWSELVDGSVCARYRTNAVSLLTVRCPQCDEVTSMWVDVAEAAGSEEAEERLLGRKRTQALADAWESFALGQSSAEKIIAELVPRCLDGKLSAQAHELLLGAASLIKDDERRLSFLLAWLRRFPKIRTPCCNRKMCFKCKVSGWHSGMTCEERQRSFVRQEEGVQSCSNCGVPTQRTEGCSHVQCVCGHSWNWETSEEVLEEESTIPLLLACVGTPISGGRHSAVSLLKNLLDRRADVHAVDRNNCTAVHYASGSVRSATADHIPQSDSSRLDALSEVFRQSDDSWWDALDGDGDSPLCIAVLELNVAAIRFLVKHGAMIRPRLIESLRSDDQAFIPVRLEILQALRPLLDEPKRWHEEMNLLNMFLDFGASEKAKELLSSTNLDCEVDESTSESFLWGQYASSSSSNSTSGSKCDSRLEKALSRRTDAWNELCQTAATDMLWYGLQCSGWTRQHVDARLMQLVISRRADIESLNEEGDSPLFAALVRHDAVATASLLNAGATFDLSKKKMVDELKGLLLLGRAKPMCDALAARMKKDKIEDPPWLALQVGLFDKKCRSLESVDKSTIQGHMVASLLKRIILGDRNSNDIEKILVAKLEIRDAEVLKKEAASALLLQEIRQAWNFEREPDFALMRSLLATFGASAHKAPCDLREELSAYAMVHGTNADEHLLPIFLLAHNTFCTLEGARNLVELLVEFKADVNCIDEEGDTPLWWALSADNATVAAALLWSGATLDEGSVVVLQSWVHPSSLKMLSPALAPQFGNNSNSWPMWMQVQFGFEIAEHFQTDEDGEDLALALLLSRYCGGDGADFDADAQRNLGQEVWQELKRQAAESALRGEIKGAFQGKWQLDAEFVSYLLDFGIDPNLRVEIEDEYFSDDDDDEEEDSLDEIDEDGETEDGESE